MLPELLSLSKAVISAPLTWTVFTNARSAITVNFTVSPAASAGIVKTPVVELNVTVTAAPSVVVTDCEAAVEADLARGDTGESSTVTLNTGV